MIRDLVLCAILWAAFLAGIATTLLYVIRRKKLVVLPPAPPWQPPKPPPWRSELPTLTDLRVEKVVGELARKCRQENAR